MWQTTLYTRPYPPFPKMASSSNSFKYREVCASKATSLDLKVKCKHQSALKHEGIRTVQGGSRSPGDY